MPRTQKSIPVEKLSEQSFREFPVWEFAAGEESLPGQDETWVRPVTELPITSAGGRLIGCEFRLADGSLLPGYLCSLSLTKKENNQHFLALTVFVGGAAKHLARYYDFDFAERGPKSLALALGKKVEQIFPILFDVSLVAAGSEDCIRGSILEEPKKKLSRSEIIQLAVKGLKKGPTSRQSQRRCLSRSVLAHGSRQPAPWLICNVGRKPQRCAARVLVDL